MFDARLFRYLLVALALHAALLAVFGSIKIVTTMPKPRVFFDAGLVTARPAPPTESPAAPALAPPVVPAGYTAHIDLPAAPESPGVIPVIGLLNDSAAAHIVRPPGNIETAGPGFPTGRPGPPGGSGSLGDGGGGVTTNHPGYLQTTAPPYPALARRNGWEGTTVLRVTVTPHGTAGAVTVLQSSGHRVLDEAATAAVRQWRFHPARVGEQPVAAQVDVPVRFLLNQ